MESYTTRRTGATYLIVSIPGDNKYLKDKNQVTKEVLITNY